MSEFNSSTAFFIQARVSSSRLPGKIIMPFYEGKSILQLIIERLGIAFPQNKLFLVASLNPKDDVLVQQMKQYRINVFRGDEHNVLKRFIDAAHHYNIKDIVRICSDNPLILPEFIQELLQFTPETFDYISHSCDNVPTMKCHFGLFAERVQLKALEKVAELTKDQLYLEHVTNFVYSNPDTFHIKLLDKTRKMQPLRAARFTIDTQDDFNTTSFIFSELIKNQEVNFDNIVSVIKSYPEMEAKMKLQQLINQK